MSWITPITDRTQSDVDRVLELNRKLRDNTITDEELTEWKTSLKGSFNLSDMERLTTNLSILDELLGTNLTMPDIVNIPRENWFRLFLNNLEVVRNSYIVYEKTPAVPTIPINTYKKFNDIEQVMLDIYTIINSRFFYCCGQDFYSGNEIGLLL